MLKLVQTALSQFDLDYESTHEDLKQSKLKTIIYAALFTDQVAPEGRVDDPYDQRGWWYNSGFGTGFWYVRRQALSQNARREATNMMIRALNAEPLLSEITVREVVDQSWDDQLRNVSRLILQVEGVYDGDKFRLVLYVANKPFSFSASQPVLNNEVWDLAWNFEWVI